MTKEQYLGWFDEVLQPTEPVFRRVPPERLEFRSTERAFSIGQLLAHIPGALSFMANVINHDELPYKSLREIMVANRRQPSCGVEEGIARLGAGRQKFTQAVGILHEDDFQRGTLDTPQMGRVPYWRYCAFTIEHHIHHLMELHICLRMLGVDVNTKSLYAG